MARQSSQSEDEWLDLFKSLGVDKVALSEASALNLHDNAAIPVHAMTVKKAAESWDNFPQNRFITGFTGLRAHLVEGRDHLDGDRREL